MFVGAYDFLTGVISFLNSYLTFKVARQFLLWLQPTRMVRGYSMFWPFSIATNQRRFSFGDCVGGVRGQEIGLVRR